MSLGVVCHAIKVVKTRTGLKEINLFENRTLQLGRFTAGEYSHEKIYDTYVHNASKVLEVLPILADEGVKLYRLSSDLLPLADKIDPAIWDTTHIRGIYKKIGDLCRARKIRVTMHPAQFCVLNSESESVIQNAVRDMQQHAWVLDACEFDESPMYAINIHAGRRDRFTELVQNIEKLPRNVRSRLTFENCETVASVEELLPVSEKTGCPIVFDSHHHTFRPGGLTLDVALDLAMCTWPSEIKPLQHIANTEPDLANGNFVDRRKHSKFIHYVPDRQLNLLRDNTVDCEVEAKAKQLAVYKMAQDFGINL